MRGVILLILSILLIIPFFSEAKTKEKGKKYYAYKKYIKYKKKRVKIIRYPFKANTNRKADIVKLEEMIKDMF